MSAYLYHVTRQPQLLLISSVTLKLMFWVKCGQECVDSYTLKMIVYEAKLYHFIIIIFEK